MSNKSEPRTDTMGGYGVHSDRLGSYHPRPLGAIDYRQRVTIPIRDTHNPNLPIVFLVDVYGLTARDLSVVPVGGLLALKAVKRLGFDPVRYQAILWDLGAF